MSHEVESMAWANEVPWHGLGSEVDKNESLETWMTKAGLDWTVQKHPLTYELDGVKHKAKNKNVLIRSSDGKEMDFCSDRWVPPMNTDTVELMRKYVTAGGATMETLGSLRDGNVIFGLARLKHEFEVTRGDKVRGYLLLTSSHKVGKANTVRLTTVRVVCANTMAMAESAGGVVYSQNHLSEFNISAAQAHVESASEGLADCERRAKIISKMKLSAEDAVAKVFLPIIEPSVKDLPANVIAEMATPEGYSTKIASIMDSYHNAPGAIEGNGWGALNAVTHWADHKAGHNPSSRMYRSWLGDHANTKTEVENKLLELAS